MKNYDEFREAREELRDELREHIASKTRDNSNRGRSVAGALRRFDEMTGAQKYSVRLTWYAAYQLQRKADREQDERYAHFAKAWLPGFVKVLTNSRKNDLLGDAWGN